MCSSDLELRLPNTARAGGAVDVEILVENDRREASFFWYVDAGTLERTGWTAAQSWGTDDPAWPDGHTGSTNRWVIPEDASGNLRLMVTVVPCPPGNDCRGGSWKMGTEYGLNMTWAQGAVEVAQ